MIYHTFIRFKKEGSNRDRDGKTADKIIKYCPRCRKSYEVINKNCHYYPDFPSYGKQKKICSPCK